MIIWKAHIRLQSTMDYGERIVEIEGEREKISVPIVNFPPLKLRALLIEKDPLVWKNILITYVSYVRYIMHMDNYERLDESTYDHFCIFVRGYLKEMSLEKGQIASLGMNEEVNEQSELLRKWIYVMIRDFGLLFLQLNAESYWDIVKLYVEDYPDSVRQLIDGILQPRINTQKASLNRIPQMQKYLGQLVESGKFSRVDLKSLENLVSGNSESSKIFASKFLNSGWIEMLESWWSAGKGKYAQIAQQLILITLYSVTSDDIIEIIYELEIKGADSLSLFPLFGNILISERFLERLPDLKHKVDFIKFSELNTESVKLDLTRYTKVRDEDVDSLSELFPQLTRYQLTELLKKFENDKALVINTMFEDPTFIDSIPAKPSVVNSGSNKEKSILDKRLDSKVKNMLTKQVPDELRNRTLSRALALLYQNDEDEIDDTYDEAEVNKGTAKLDIDQDEKSSGTSKYDEIERYLWELLIKDKGFFLRDKRGSRFRKEIKHHTGWVDEQIEGWARMLERSPQRARLLEEKYIFRGNTKAGKTSYVENTRNGKRNVPVDENSSNESKSRNTSIEKVTVSSKTTKKKQSRDEKNKASKANHNRRAAHDKKLRNAQP